ncbi:hypothetical protein [Azospirillum sp. INR13]|uniref:hypothetical protein n=1 Tax=Azospirillum sp. INR13 TaxID=2596919 RepID=UPI0021021C18|nr:hypothetical protein [Azospirillum sp. INR13]
MNEALNTDPGADAPNMPREGESLSPVVAAILAPPSRRQPSAAAAATSSAG